MQRTQQFSTEAESLRTRLRGPVFLPGDDGYDDERSGFQIAPRLQRRPAVIVGATSPEDVQAAVLFAREHDIPVAVQATGHGPANSAGESLLISTRRMTGVRIDVAARTATIEAGVRWDQVIAETAPHGLAPLSGSAPRVGVVSYTLGGGLGLLARQYGYAADSVRDIEVVTADGRLRQVDTEHDPDLFWALRGGKDNFGVVTSLTVDLMPVAQLYGGALVFDRDQAPDVLETYRTWSVNQPEEMTSSVALIPVPNLPFVPEFLRGRYIIHLRISYTGDPETGEELVAPLRAIGPRLLDTLKEMPYAESGTIYNDPTAPDAYCGDNALVRDLEPATLRLLLDLAGPEAQPPCIIEIRHLGGALGRPPAAPNAIGYRDARYLLRVFSPLGGADFDAAQALHNRVFDAVAPWSLGRSVNFIYGENTAPEQVRDAYDPDDYQRLTELKAIYDPTNLFRLNLNIPPAPERTAESGTVAART